MPTVAAQASTTLRRWITNVSANWRKAPLELISYFGATVFFVGFFLALWFSVQGFVARNSIWFSWCYLIVLLHVLGGSILFALGKVGTLATSILEKIEARPESEPKAVVPATALRDAA